MVDDFSLLVKATASCWIRSQFDAAESLANLGCLYKAFFRLSGLVGHRLMRGEILGIAGPVERRLNPVAWPGAL